MTTPQPVVVVERLVCRGCGWAGDYDPEWPTLTVRSMCPGCFSPTLVWMRFGERQGGR